MTDQRWHSDLVRGTKIITHSKRKQTQPIGLEQAQNLWMKSSGFYKREKSNFEELTLDDLQTNFHNQTYKKIKQIASLPKRTSEDSMQFQKMSSKVQNSKLESPAESLLLQSRNFKIVNNKVVLQRKQRWDASFIKKMLQTHLNDFQSTKQTFQDNAYVNKPAVFPNLAKVLIKKGYFQEQKKKISSLLREIQKQPEKQEIESTPKQKSICFKNNKQSFCEDELYRKRQKSMKKVAFEQSNVQKPKNQKKLTLNINNTSILVDELNSEASRMSIYQQKMPIKSNRVSQRLLSQHGSFRYLRVKGQQSIARMMVKQVQLRNQDIEKREEQLFKISHENKHSNIVYMFAKNKILRNNKKFLEITMQLYQKNLADYIVESDQSPFTQIQRKIVLFQIIKALIFLHGREIYHRDLNPMNIMVGDRLKIALTNFAFVQSPQMHECSPYNYYQCNSFIRPPEIILNPMRPFDKGGDIWALGCIILFMLKGQLPFIECSDADILLQIMKFVGKPSKQYLKKINFNQHKRFVFPDLPHLSIKEFFHCYDDSLLKILKSIFVFESQKRPTAQNLLASPYFEQLRDEQRFNNLKKNYEISDLFDFSSHQLERGRIEQIIPSWYQRK